MTIHLQEVDDVRFPEFNDALKDELLVVIVAESPKECYVCLQYASSSDRLVQPCKCSSFIHQRCLIDLSKDYCIVCREEFICNCPSSCVVSRSAILWFIGDLIMPYDRCRLCQARILRSEPRPNASCIAKSVFRSILGLLIAVFCVFLVAPQSFLGDSKSFSSIASGENSFLLFPGTPDLLILDVFYILSCLMSAIIGFCQLSLRLARQRMQNWLLYLLFLPLLINLIHLCGNFHYYFYCKVGAIEERNCFPVYDLSSLVVGPAGAILLAIFSFILYATVKGLWFYCSDQ